MPDKFAVVEIDRDVEAVFRQLSDRVAGSEEFVEVTWTIADRIQAKYGLVWLGVKTQ